MRTLEVMLKMETCKFLQTKIGSYVDKGLPYQSAIICNNEIYLSFKNKVAFFSPKTECHSVEDYIRVEARLRIV